MFGRKILILFGLLLICVAGKSHSQSTTKTEYYAGISGVISPFLEYHPVLPVTKAEAQTISHFRVIKNANDTLLEMAWFDKSTPSNRSYFGTHKVVYRHTGDGNYSRKYYDAKGQPAFMWRHYFQGGDIHEERYTIQEEQRFVRLFDAKGHTTESGIGAHRFTARFLDDRRFVQTQVSLSGDIIPFRKVMPFMTVIISVDGDGYLDKVLNVDGTTLEPKFNFDVGYAALKVNFDSNGLELGWEYQDEKGSLVNLPASDLDEPGAALTVWFKQWRNQRLNLWQHLYVRYYDKTGAVVADNRDAYLLHHRKDKHNRLVETTYYNADGGLHFVEREGFARKEYHYEQRGKNADRKARIERRYDANNQLIPD